LDYKVLTVAQMEQNKILRELEREFKDKKQNAEQKADRFLELLKISVPDFAALDKAYRELELDAAKKNADGQNIERERERLKELTAKKEELLRARKIDPKRLLPEYECALCEDSGGVGASPCACFVGRLNERLSEDSGIKHNKNLTFKNSDLNKVRDAEHKKQLEGLYEVSAEFCRKFPNTTKKNILLVGKSGVGKTYLLNCIVNELIAKNRSVVYLTAFALNNLFVKFHTKFDEDKSLYFESLIECDLLVIDDLGSEPILKNVTKEYLFSLINERCIRKKSTFYSTNLDLSGLRSIYGDRIYSRITDKESTMMFNIEGADIRNRTAK
jgi:DNA replication protein DnaC